MKRVSGQPGMLRAIGRFIEVPYNGVPALQSAEPIEPSVDGGCSLTPGS
jgi:hypothetical protein